MLRIFLAATVYFICFGSVCTVYKANNTNVGFFSSPRLKHDTIIIIEQKTAKKTIVLLNREIYVLSASTV